MRRLLYCTTLVFLLTACDNGKQDINRAKACAEGCLGALETGRYEEVFKSYYSSELANEESLQTITMRYDSLRTACGAVQTFTVQETEYKTETDSGLCFSLSYMVTYKKCNATHDFVVRKDDGQYKIAAHRLRNE